MSASWNPMNRDYWNSLTLTEREDICARAGWVTKQAKHTGRGWIGGNITPMGKRIAKTSWDKLSDAAQVVLLRFGEYLREDREHNPRYSVKKSARGYNPKSGYIPDPKRIKEFQDMIDLYQREVAMFTRSIGRKKKETWDHVMRRSSQKHLTEWKEALADYISGKYENPVTYTPDHPEVGKAGARYLKAVSTGADPVTTVRKEYDKVYKYISHTDFLKYIGDITPKRTAGSTPAYMGGATPMINAPRPPLAARQLAENLLYEGLAPEEIENIIKKKFPSMSKMEVEMMVGTIFSTLRGGRQYYGKDMGGRNPGARGAQVMTYGARLSSTGSGNYYPVVNGTPYYTRISRTKAGAEAEAKRMAQAGKKELERGGYRISVLKENCPCGSHHKTLKENCWFKDPERHSDAAKKGWVGRRAKGTVAKVKKAVQATAKAQVIPSPRIKVSYLGNDQQYIAVKSPYHPELPVLAKQTGGKWDSSGNVWYFDRRIESRVKDLFLRVYHEWNEIENPVNLIVDVTRARAQSTPNLNNDFQSWHGTGQASLWVGGRLIAERRGRDYSVKTGNGVILLTGGWPNSGGSVKNVSLATKEGTTVEIMDMPGVVAARLIKAHPDIFSLDTGLKSNPVKVSEAKKILSEAKKRFGKENVTSLGQAISLLTGARKNPGRLPVYSSSDGGKSNLPPGATKIYDNVLALEARKGRASMWPGEEFRHDFKTIKGKASVYGLTDGSLLIKGNKRLWKKFNYPNKGNF